MGRRGSIARIALHNVGTYKNVDVFPGPNLNLIIGPNGTGKSTIVSGIILGLGGNPKVIGRASQLGDYVKTNCTSASIEVELESGNESENIVITRNFNKSSQTFWKLNGKNVHQKDILKVISDYDIQVNNLCQFLPQDRVQDFAKMNNYELLVNTEKSVGTALHQYHEQLIELRGQHVQLEMRRLKQESLLKDEEQRNQRIAGLVRNITQRKLLLENIKNMDAKLTWLTYDKKRLDSKEVQEHRNKAKEILNKYRTEAEPIKKQLASAKRKIEKEQQSIININRLVNESQKVLKDKEEMVDKLGSSIKHAETEFKRKIEEENNRMNLVNETKAKSNKFKNDLDIAIQEFGTEKAIDVDVSNLVPKIQSCESQIQQLNSRKSKIDFTLERLRSEIRHCKQEKESVEDVKRQRLETLRKIDLHAYQATQWLKENRNLFQGNVYDPILLEININDPAYAKYVENIIPLRDLTAFTCEESTDLNLLIKHLRIDKNLRVSAVHSGREHTQFSAFRHPIPLDQIRRFGFLGYASTLFTGPEPIMKYLCRVYRIHAVPIGSATTNQMCDEIPSNLTLFFSDTHRYSVSVSRYTNEKISSSSEVPPARLLTVSLDNNHLLAIKKKIANHESTETKEMKSLLEIENQIKGVSETRYALLTHRQQLHSNKDQIRKITAKLNASLTSLRSLEQTNFNVEEEKERCKRKIQKTVLNIIKILAENTNHFENFQNHLIQSQLANLQLDRIRKDVSKLTKEDLTLQDNIKNVQETVNNIQANLTRLRKVAIDAFEDAKQKTDGFTPNDQGFEKYSEIFENLPSLVDELEEKITDLQTQVDCMNEVDDTVANEYEKRLKLIETLGKENSELAEQLGTLTSQMETLRNEWLPQLQDLVNNINRRFSEYFHRMNCAGEVSLTHGIAEHSYDQFGLSIKVRYRDGEKLQELDQYVQSGGERAVATAIYLLSLQELTHVPFRCVDEINQGMDAINERKIFELIVDSTSETNTSQYFLLTPKLLPGLKYTKGVKIHTIHNGPFEIAGDQYDSHKIIDKKRLSMSF